MIWKVLCNDVSVRQQDVANSLEETKQNNGISRQLQWGIYYSYVRVLGGESHLGKSFHIVANDLRVGTLQFADDFKALIELREHVHHGAGEQSVLWCDLELEREKKEQVQGDKVREAVLWQCWCCNTVIQHQEWGVWFPWGPNTQCCYVS